MTNTDWTELREAAEIDSALRGDTRVDSDQLKALISERDELSEAALRLANAADEVGVNRFDTDTLDDDVSEMQQATLAVREALRNARTGEGGE